MPPHILIKRRNESRSAGCRLKYLQMRFEFYLIHIASFVWWITFITGPPAAGVAFVIFREEFSAELWPPDEGSRPQIEVELEAIKVSDRFVVFDFWRFMMSNKNWFLFDVCKFSLFLYSANAISSLRNDLPVFNLSLSNLTLRPFVLPSVSTYLDIFTFPRLMMRRLAAYAEWCVVVISGNALCLFFPCCGVCLCVSDSFVLWMKFAIPLSCVIIFESILYCKIDMV